MHIHFVLGPALASPALQILRYELRSKHTLALPIRDHLRDGRRALAGYCQIKNCNLTVALQADFLDRDPDYPNATRHCSFEISKQARPCKALAIDQRVC